MSNWQSVRMLVKRWPWILAATLLCAVALWSSAQIQRKVGWRASATLLLQPVASQETQDAMFSNNSKAAVALLGSGQFRDDLAQNLSLDRSKLNQLSVDTGLGDAILRFTYVDDDDARQAQDTANAVADFAQRALNDASLPLRAQALARAVAAQPVEPLDGGKTRGALGAGLGFALSLCVLLLRYYLSDTIKNGNEVRELLGRPVLAEHPRIPEILRVAQRHSQRLRHSMEGLAVHVRYGLQGEGGAIAVASARRGDGKTAVAAGMAQALTEGGRTVLLVDLDGQHPALHKAYKLNPTAGAAQVLAGDCALEQAALPVAATPGLSVLCAGKGGCDNADAIQGLLAQAGAGYDFVVASLPAIGSHAYATAAARLFDRVVLVAKAESTTLRQAREALGLLDAAGATVRGVALTDA